MKIIELCVHLDCPGCQKKVEKALLKLKGVKDVEIDMARQKVTVTGWADQKKILATIRKTGRSAVLWPSALDRAEYTTSYPPPVAHQQVQQPPIHQLIFNVDTASYNYHKHGYGDATFYQANRRVQPDYSHIIADETRARFSDDNPAACSIM